MFTPLPYLSVILTAYNAADTIGEQLAALQAQHYDGPWELLVVNNRSTDGTIVVVQQYQAALPQLRLVQADQRQGLNYARNSGAAAARGTHMVCCDADDVAAPGWLAAMGAALAEHHVVSGAIEERRLNRDNLPRPPQGNTHSEPFLGFLPTAIGCNMAISQEAFARVGKFDETLGSGGDVDMSWRLQLAGYRLHHAPEAVMHYRYRRGWRSTWRQFRNYAVGQVALYQRYKAHGMPRPPLAEVAGRYGRMLRQFPRLWLWEAPRTRLRGVHRLRDDPQLTSWWLWSAVCWGRIAGSLKYRTLYL
ncbi:MAG: glycosyltransferase family 2 protein [Chloroflexaceae bacterium]|jgi:glycosyltransferase involved in cell wall biosynthesis|nr:glycosyltransferase family 2 protein [Chloroflexaceae bacterium]